MARAPAALALAAVLVAGLLLVSGGSDSDPRTPAGLPWLPPPFLGTAVVGNGRATAAVDAYGDVVDLRPSPAGAAWLAVPAARQAAGTVAPAMAIVPRLRLADARRLPFWRADAVWQRYLPGTNVLVTTARFGGLAASVAYFGRGDRLGCLTQVWSDRSGRGDPAGDASPSPSPRIRLSLDTPSVAVGRHLRCQANRGWSKIVAAARSDRRWLAGSAPLASSAPPWSRRFYERSLLTLRALTDRRAGAVAAGARGGWAYVWPRDASAVAQAFAAAGHSAEARRVAGFLRSLDLGAAARFEGDGAPVAGRGPQGDAGGWVAILAADPSTSGQPGSLPRLPDYQEKAAGEYLGNAIAATATEPPRKRSAEAASIARAFASDRGLDRVAGSPDSGIDSAAAWAVRPFALPGLYPAARASLRQMLAGGNRFGIVPSSDWPDRDPWTAPTAWSAWAFAALTQVDRQRGDSSLARADRRDALALLADLRHAATPTGELPERVDAQTGAPRSTTPLAWSHAFAVLALRELWPAAGSISLKSAQN